MISEFEARLADTLGTRIGSPFTGRVDVAPGEDPGTGVRVVVGVTGAQIIDNDLGSRRLEVVPGDTSPRRAVRMRCTVSLQVRATSAGRADQMKALDAALYALDAADFRSGTVLADGTDRGFVIHELQASALAAPLDPQEETAPPVTLEVIAIGLFWPVGVVGEAGRIIDEIHFRGGVLPIEVTPVAPILIAGGSAAELTIRFDTTALLLEKNSVTSMPFGALAVTLVGPGGKPGKGTITGGAAGATPEIRLLTVENESATVTYTPPPAAAVDELVITFANAAKGLGIEIGRVRLTTRSA